MRLQHRSAAIRHQEVAALAARFGDPLWIRARKQRAGRMLLISQFGTGRHPCSSRPPRRKPAHGISPLRALARKALQPLAEIGGTSAKPAFRQDRGNARRFLRLPVRPGLDHHPRQTGRQRQVAHAPAGFGDCAFGIECAEPREKRPRLVPGRRRRWIQPGESKRFPHAPMGKIEHEAGQIGIEDFRPRKRLECPVRRRLPQTVADARFGAPCPATALVGSRTRHAYRLESRQANAGLVSRQAGKPAVDDDAHSINGD